MLEDEDHPFLQRAYSNPEIRYPLGTPLKRRGDLESWLDDDADRLLTCLDEGRIRKDRFVDGAYRDTIQYGLLLEEWSKTGTSSRDAPERRSPLDRFVGFLTATTVESRGGDDEELPQLSPL